MTMRETFESISKQVLLAAPKLEAMTEASTDVLIESEPIVDVTGMHAGIWGPFPNEEKAQLYLRAKRDRNRIRAAEHFAKGRGIENDGHHFCHPEFRYRFLPLREYYMRVLAQIIVNAMGGMIETVVLPMDFDTYDTIEESFGPDLDGESVEDK